MRIGQRLIEKVRDGKSMYYEYTVKYDSLDDSDNMRKYLLQILQEGVDMSHSVSASCSNKMIIQVQDVVSELEEFAEMANYRGKGKDQHLTVQKFLLENDPCGIGYEIPVLHKDGSCFIDYLRYKDGKYHVCDFKPNAKKETKAASQVFLNMKWLSHVTGIPFKMFEGYYFDDRNCYKLIF